MTVWADLEDILATDTTDVMQVGQIIDLYLDVMADFLSSSRFKCVSALRGAEIFLNSDVMHAHTTYCRRRLVALLTTKIDQPSEYMASLGAIVLRDIDQHSTPIAQIVAESGAVPQVVATLWLFRYTDTSTTLIYIGVLYRLCITKQLPVSDLHSLTYDLIEYLYRRVCDNDDDPEDADDDTLLLLLALNEQYVAQSIPENKVVNVLKSNLLRYRAVGGKVVLLANRTSSTLIKVLVCKFLYYIFTTPETFNFIYTNDLKVLVEVLLRELSDLPDEADDLRQMYLRVLHVLLDNTTICEEKFKQSDIVSVLRCSIESSEGETRRIAERCLSVEWLQWSRHGSFVSISSEEASRLGSDSDYSSDEDPPVQASRPYPVTLRGKPLPPPPRSSKIRPSSATNIALAGSNLPPPPPPQRLHKRT